MVSEEAHSQSQPPRATPPAFSVPVFAHQRPPLQTQSEPRARLSPAPKERKSRARPTISCLECRRKKLKCDRLKPCGQCQKGGRNEGCVYAEGVKEAGAGSASPLNGDANCDGGESSGGGKRRRLDELGMDGREGDHASPGKMGEHGMARSEEDGNPSSRHGDGAPDVSLLTLGRIDVKGSRSKYLGAGDRMVMLDQFEDVKRYILDSFKDPDTVEMMNEMSLYQRTLQRKPKKSQTPLPADRPSLVIEMLRSIPLDDLSSLGPLSYLVHWESVNRILHFETFTKQSDQLFEYLRTQAETGIDALPSHIYEWIVPQVLATFALSARLESTTLRKISEDQISEWVDMIQSWLGGLRGKELLNIQTVRIQALLVLVKMNTLVSTSDLWKESGTLVRSGMIIGLHLDPESHTGFSLFEKEQRRKLWHTIVELDIQFSLATSMPPSIRSEHFNSRLVRNVDDSYLSEDMVSYPPSEKEDIWTDALPQVLLSSTIKERLNIANMLAGNINLDRDAEGMFKLAQNLERSLHLIPSPLGGRDHQRVSGRLLGRIMLDMQIRRPALCIYRSMLLDPHWSRYPEARRGVLRNAVAILNHLDALDPTVADPNVIKNSELLDLFHILCKNDILQAALICCFEIRNFGSGPSFPEDEMFWTKTSLTRIVENTLNSFLQRLGKLGSDLKDVLPLSVVLQSARSRGSPEDHKALMKKGAERIWKACRDTLSDIPPTPAASHSQNGDDTSSQQQLALQDPLYSSYQFQDSAGPKHLFGDAGLIPGAELNFQDFDFGFTDWDTNQSWF